MEKNKKPYGYFKSQNDWYKDWINRPENAAKKKARAEYRKQYYANKYKDPIYRENHKLRSKEYSCKHAKEIRLKTQVYYWKKKYNTLNKKIDMFNEIVNDFYADYSGSKEYKERLNKIGLAKK